MVSKFALFSNLLLAAAALASPFPRHGARLAHRRENRQSQPINHIESRDDNKATSPHWAGAVVVDQPGTFISIQGTFTLPTFTSSSGSGATIWVGIDGYSCSTVLFHTGITISVSDNGEPSYSAYYAWLPDTSHHFDTPITVSAGNVIRATILAASSTSGTAIIENLTTGETAIQPVSSTNPLCQQDAEWIVGDPILPSTGKPMPFANLGQVTFSNAAANDLADSQYIPNADSGYTVVNLKQDGNVLTSVNFDEGVIISWL